MRPVPKNDSILRQAGLARQPLDQLADIIRRHFAVGSAQHDGMAAIVHDQSGQSARFVLEGERLQPVVERPFSGHLRSVRLIRQLHRAVGAQLAAIVGGAAGPRRSQRGAKRLCILQRHPRGLGHPRFQPFDIFVVAVVAAVEREQRRSGMRMQAGDDDLLGGQTNRLREIAPELPILSRSAIQQIERKHEKALAALFQRQAAAEDRIAHADRRLNPSAESSERHWGVGSDVDSGKTGSKHHRKAFFGNRFFLQGRTRRIANARDSGAGPLGRRDAPNARGAPTRAPPCFANRSNCLCVVREALSQA
ncbi:MAG: hypothetical protein BWZ10_01803 [candidate division BRC1 bacterium ADurb.BinA364]|nr:MAG: hypothetical protein BWZ10_01803 [candidate division BRC1 bacterium ADurb.BinA364]